MPRASGLRANDAPTPAAALLLGVETCSRNGRNSFLRRAWLPPDPPLGHGVHRYAFQVFALLPGDEYTSAPGRKELANAIRQRAIGSGLLVGHYQRA